MVSSENLIASERKELLIRTGLTARARRMHEKVGLVFNWTLVMEEHLSNSHRLG